MPAEKEVFYLVALNNPKAKALTYFNKVHADFMCFSSNRNIHNILPREISV